MTYFSYCAIYTFHGNWFSTTTTKNTYISSPKLSYFMWNSNLHTQCRSTELATNKPISFSFSSNIYIYILLGLEMYAIVLCVWYVICDVSYMMIDFHLFCAQKEFHHFRMQRCENLSEYRSRSQQCQNQKKRARKTRELDWMASKSMYVHWISLVSFLSN